MAKDKDADESLWRKQLKDDKKRLAEKTQQLADERAKKEKEK